MWIISHPNILLDPLPYSIARIVTIEEWSRKSRLVLALHDLLDCHITGLSNASWAPSASCHRLGLSLIQAAIPTRPRIKIILPEVFCGGHQPSPCRPRWIHVHAVASWAPILWTPIGRANISVGGPSLWVRGSDAELQSLLVLFHSRLLGF